MELKSYWNIIVRRGWVVVAVFALALGASLAGFALVPQAVSYQATVRIAVKPPLEPKTGDYYTYDEYYAYLTSEFLNDDLIELVQGGLFMQELQGRLKGKFPSPPAGSIKAKKAHRVLTMTVTSGTGDGALALAQTAVDALSEKADSGQRYFGQLTAKEPTVSIVDPPAITATPATRGVMDLALRGIVGLLAGLSLAFLLDYLDDTLRGAKEAEELLGLPVLGEIPGERAMRARAKVAARQPA
jgi:capsular polysaccharide biosynthesis protein